MGAPKKFTDTVDVTREDQEKINKFSRLNQRLTDVDAAVSSRQKIVKDITDASEIGEDFFLRTCDNIGDLIDREQKMLSDEVSKYESERKTISDEMDHLKTQLYAKFGDQIHLERE